MSSLFTPSPTHTSALLSHTLPAHVPGYHSTTCTIFTDGSTDVTYSSKLQLHHPVLSFAHTHPLIKRPARDACLCMGDLQAPAAPAAPHFVFLITL